MSLRIRELTLRRTQLRTRMPFRYGVAVMTELPHVFLTADVEIDGHVSRGQSAENLPPRWFTKDTSQHPEDEIRDMMRVIKNACRVAVELPVAASAFDLWWSLYHEHRLGMDEVPGLLVGLGPSLIERALIDAVCRAGGIPFGLALRENVFGIELGRVHPELKDLRGWPSASITTRLALRHTIGLSDPLTEADLGGDSRLDDGLPQTLVESIRAYGLHFFKLKIQGHPEADLERIRSVEKVLAAEVPRARLTVDGNEQYDGLDVFRDFWQRLSADAGLRRFRDRLLYVEQPFRRDVALQEPLVSELRRWVGRPRIIIDESDSDLGAFRLALSSGYAGGSYKSCKGVFRGLANAALARQRDAIISAEDLAGIGPIAMLQDTAVVAALGLEHAERNGHHYFRGLSMFPQSVCEELIASHDDLFTRREDGLTALRINDGMIDLGSVNRAAFGCAPLVDTGAFEKVGHY